MTESHETEGRSAGVNSKTVRWTVLEEGKPCKRGLPLVAVTVMYVLPLSGNGSCSVPDCRVRHGRVKSVTNVTAKTSAADVNGKRQLKTLKSSSQPTVTRPARGENHGG